MDDALELLDLAVCGIALFPPAGLVDDELHTGVVCVQRHIDRLKVLHAGLVHEADLHRVWAAGGARDVADWLADQTKTSRGDAASRARLGAALKASPKLQEAAEHGDVSAATAESLFDAVTNPPDGTTDSDVDQLVDACKGADPRDAKHAADGMGQLTAVLPIVDLRQVTNSISHVAGKPCEADTRTTEQRMADGLVQLCIAYAKGQVTGGREKPTILLTIPADTYTGGSDGDGMTAHGDRIPAHVVRFLAEQATLQRVVTAGNQIVNVGRAERYATDTQYKALVVRDGGCRWPGCRLPAAWCDIDHLQPWEDGGTTDLDNLVMWCRHHHTLKHTPGVSVSGSVGDDLTLHLPNSTHIHCPPQGQASRQQPGRQRPGATAPPPTKAAA